MEQWLKKFVAVAKLNGWWGNTELMPVQFLLHLKGTAIDWYQENEEYFKRANWTEVETAFVERFKRSDAASAMDLQRIKQEDNEDVQAFAERFSRIQARFPGTPEGVKVAQFRSKIHKKFDQVMAANMPKTLRTAVNLARCAE